MKESPDLETYLTTAWSILILAGLGFFVHTLMWQGFINGQARLPVPARELHQPSLESPASKPEPRPEPRAPKRKPPGTLMA